MFDHLEYFLHSTLFYFYFTLFKQVLSLISSRAWFLLVLLCSPLVDCIIRRLEQACFRVGYSPRGRKREMRSDEMDV
jgi:hypothetical protein